MEIKMISNINIDEIKNTIFNRKNLIILTPVQLRIFSVLLDNKNRRIEEFIKELNIPRTTIYDNLIKLEKKRFIFKRYEYKKIAGRPIILWQIRQAHNLILFNNCKKIGVVGSGKYKNKNIVIKKLEKIVNKNNDIIVSGHSPRNGKIRRDGNIYYDNVDIWSEEWAYDFCVLDPIIYPAEEFNRYEFFKRNKEIAIDSKELHVFINRNQYESGAWNTVKQFIEKPNFKQENLYIYDEKGIRLKLEELPEWCQKKIKEKKINLYYIINEKYN